MARESCRQGPSFASRSPKSRMARRCCQRRPAFPRQRHAAWPNGLCALRRGPGLLAACAPLSSRPRSSPPSYTRRASPPASRPRTPPSAAPPIAVGVSADRALSAALVLSTPTHRVHRCALAGAARAPTRANWAPALSQPGLARPWSHLRPPAPRHPPRLALPRGFRCGSGNSCEMVR